MRRPLDKTDAYCINQQGRGDCVSSVFRKKLKEKIQHQLLLLTLADKLWH